MIDVFKLGVALVFAAIAALTAIVAGLLSDARVQIVLGRAFCSFIVSGLIVYLGITLFDRLGYASIIHDMEESLKKSDDEEDEAVDDGISANEEEQAVTEEGTEAEAGDGFVPLQADALRHVASEQGE